MDPRSIELYQRHYGAGWRALKRVMLLDSRPYRKPGIWRRWNARSAIAHFAECLRLAPQQWQCAWATAKAYQALGDDKEALVWFERAAVIEPDHPDIFGEAYLSAAFLGDARRAEVYARRAVDLRPENDRYLANYAFALLLNDRVAEALDAARQACTMNPAEKTNGAILRYVMDVRSGKRPLPRSLPK